MRDFMAITRALADESRTRALMCLRGGELCVCQIMELLRLAPSTVSKHLTILHQAGLIEARKEGRWLYYELPGPKAPAPVRQAVRWTVDSLKDDPQAVEDLNRVKVVRRMDKDELCCRYKRARVK